MKYSIAIIVLILFLILYHFFDFNYKVFIGVAIVLLIYVILFLWEYSIFKNNFHFDYRFKNQTKAFDVFSLIFPVIYTLLFTINNYISESEILLIIVFWSFPVIEIFMRFIYKIKKPYTIFIKDDQLMLNKRSFKSRNLSNLVQISYNRFTKNLVFDFEKNLKFSYLQQNTIQKILRSHLNY